MIDRSQPCFYASAADTAQGKPALLVGPFATKEEADVYGYGDKRKLMTDEACRVDCRAPFYGYGVVKMRSGKWDGQLNAAVGYTPTVQ